MFIWIIWQAEWPWYDGILIFYIITNSYWS